MVCMPKRVLCLMDLSIVGRASLSAAPCVLSACGVQCCPFPASLLSTHTGGFENVQILDLSEFGMKALDHIVAEGTHFDAVYIGYLNSPGQFRLAQKALDEYPGSKKIVDPSMGDEGSLYQGITQQTVEGMRALCAQADLITPNVTESALLTGNNPSHWTAKEARASLDTLGAKGTSVLVTSVELEEGGLGMLGYVPGENKRFTVPVNTQPKSYPGTGDLFTAALTGLMLSGMRLAEAAGVAGRFIEAAIRRTTEGGGVVRQGTWFEPCLHILTSACEDCRP
ncbi:PfkB family carbohydrate kinase [Ruminococcaceae bacterium OttesenSCG-928-I18]|nr:PfkB family carbohydrate kinase [Ruminococcaceae bacterium OttesenSCG-928-I18]